MGGLLPTQRWYTGRHTEGCQDNCVLTLVSGQTAQHGHCILWLQIPTFALNAGGKDSFCFLPVPQAWNDYSVIITLFIIYWVPLHTRWPQMLSPSKQQCVKRPTTRDYVNSHLQLSSCAWLPYKIFFFSLGVGDRPVKSFLASVLVPKSTPLFTMQWACRAAGCSLTMEVNQ